MKYLLRSGVLLVVIFCFILINLKAQSPESPEPEPPPEQLPETTVKAQSPEPEPPPEQMPETAASDSKFCKSSYYNQARRKSTIISYRKFLKNCTDKTNSWHQSAFWDLQALLKKQNTSTKISTADKIKSKFSGATGYKDIKFGMTIDDIQDLGVCVGWYTNPYSWIDLSTANCYKIGGERRHFIFKGNNGIHQIQIDLGTYTFESFNKLSNTIGKKYKKVFSHVLDDGYALVCFNDNKIALRSGLIRSKHPTKEGYIIEETKTFIIYNDGPNKTCKMFAPADVSSDDF